MVGWSLSLMLLAPSLGIGHYAIVTNTITLLLLVVSHWLILAVTGHYGLY